MRFEWMKEWMQERVADDWHPAECPSLREAAGWRQGQGEQGQEEKGDTYPLVSIVASDPDMFVVWIQILFKQQKSS